MIVQLETRLDSPASECTAAVTTPALFQHVASPWLGFKPVVDSEWPTRWEPGPFPIRMKLFGWLPLGVQTVDISVPVVGPGTFRVRDNGHSALIERWDISSASKPSAAARDIPTGWTIGPDGARPWCGCLREGFSRTGSGAGATWRPPATWQASRRC